MRLLKILPGDENTPIAITLENVHWGISYQGRRTPKYAALSYTWGAETACRIITVNGRDLAITPNLDDALRELRARPVWTIPDS